MEIKKDIIYVIVDHEGYMRCASSDSMLKENGAWRKFFKDEAKHILPISEAIRAYKSIGYRCLECRVIPLKEVE